MYLISKTEANLAQYFSSVYAKADLNLSGAEMNHISMELLMICSALGCLGELWSFMLCIKLGQFENVVQIVTGLLIVLVQAPLFIQIGSLLLQKVYPAS